MLYPVLLSSCSSTFQHILSVHFGCPEPSVNTDQQTLRNAEMSLEQCLALYSVAVGGTESVQSAWLIERDGSYCKQLLTATGEERRVTLLALSCSIEFHN